MDVDAAKDRELSEKSARLRQEELQRERARMEAYYSFTGRGRIKLMENPWIPIGCIVTAGVLASAFRSFLKGNVRALQNRMRWRVVAQGATVIAFMGGAAVWPKIKEKWYELLMGKLNCY